MMMTWEGTSDATRWGGWEIKVVGMTEGTTTKSEEIYWYTPFVRSLRRDLRQQQDQNWNRNHNWN